MFFTKWGITPRPLVIYAQVFTFFLLAFLGALSYSPFNVVLKAALLLAKWTIIWALWDPFRELRKKDVP